MIGIVPYSLCYIVKDTCNECNKHFAIFTYAMCRCDAYDHHYVYSRPHRYSRRHHTISIKNALQRWPGLKFKSHRVLSCCFGGNMSIVSIKLPFLLVCIRCANICVHTFVSLYWRPVLVPLFHTHGFEI